MSILSPDPAKYALCVYFLSGYLKANRNDDENFPPDQFPDGFKASARDAGRTAFTLASYILEAWGERDEAG